MLFPEGRRVRFWLGIASLTLFVLFFGTALIINAILVHNESKQGGGFEAKARWAHGVLIADVSYDGVNLAANDPIEILWVTMDGVSGDHPAPNTSNDGSVTIAFRNFAGSGNTKSMMHIRFRDTRNQAELDQNWKVDVPTKA